jgi:hypothetical protein
MPNDKEKKPTASPKDDEILDTIPGTDANSISCRWNKKV